MIQMFMCEDDRVNRLDRYVDSGKSRSENALRKSGINENA